MDIEQKLLIADFILYMLTLIYWVKKKKFNVGIFILSIMTISHLGAIFYYDILSSFGTLIHIEMTPLIYLYTTILICLYPFLSHNGIRNINTNGNMRLIQALSFFIIIISIEPFIENMILLFHSSDVNYSDVYSDRMDGKLQNYSFIGAKLMGWSSHFRIFAVAAFFYFCTKEKQYKYVKLGLGGVLLNYLLMGINNGSRGDLMTLTFLYVCCFLLLYSSFPRKFIFQIRKIFLIILIPVTLIFATITLDRYNSGTSNKTLVGWLLLYSSEGPIKFCNEMWNGEHNTNGDVNMNLFKDILGLKTYTTYEDRENHYIAKNNRRIEVFYTFIGDFVSDFGIYWTFILCLCLMRICVTLYSHNNTIKFSSIMLLLYLAHLYSIGFASNVYRSYNQQKSIFITLIIFFILNITSQKHKKHINHEDFNRNGNV